MAVICYLVVYTIAAAHGNPLQKLSVVILYCAELVQRPILEYNLFEIEKYFQTSLAILYYGLLLISDNI